MPDIKDYRLDDGAILPGIEDHAGEVRILGRTPPPAGKLQAVAPTWKGAGKPVIPRSDWKQFAGDWRRPNVPIKDQDGRGACNAFAWTNVVELLRDQAGQTPQALSPWFLYAQINGGRDAGSNISDGAEYLLANGLPVDSAVPQRAYLKRQIPQEAYADLDRFTLADGETYVCEDFDDMVSAAIMRHKLNGSVYVGGQFNNLDSDHCAPVQRGMGNHAIMIGEGLLFTAKGEPFLIARNSWTDGWGWGGYFGYREGHFAYQSYFECIASKATVHDPRDPNLMPPAR